MKRIFTVALTGAFFSASGAVLPATAQEQSTKEVQCTSKVGERQSCPVEGEVVSAALVSYFGEVPCILGYTWGLEQNGIWTGNGCSANLLVTLISEQEKQVEQQADPDRLRERLRDVRQRLRKARSEVQQEREERKRIEGELAEAQAALAQVGQKRQANKNRRPNWSVRSVSACGRKATREMEKSGATNARVIEIVSARPVEGTWLVIGRASAEYGNGRRPSYFRCWVEKGEVQSFENAI